MKLPPSGPMDAKIMIVGEHPYASDFQNVMPFSGSTGQELTKMLHEAGIARTECYLTYVYKDKVRNFDFENLYAKNTQAVRIGSPELQQAIKELQEEIERVNPDVIISLGDGALWALTGNRGITKWRSSLLRDAKGRWIIPTYDPVKVMRMWSWRAITIHDLRRAARQAVDPIQEPPYEFSVRPSYEDTINTLGFLRDKVRAGPIRLSVDIETRNKHIACLGIAWTRYAAICIPFMCVERVEGYWSFEEEFIIIRLIGEILTHPNAQIIGQNFLYDNQYIAKHWGQVIKIWLDTMVTHAVCYPGTTKGLDYLSSMYCKWHVYWKDESKEWDPKLGEEQLWLYNCKDCCATYEVAEVLTGLVTHFDLTEPFEFEMESLTPLLRMMLRGVRIDMKRRDEMMWELQEALQAREAWFESLDLTGGIPLVKSKTASSWYKSPKQQSKLFYEIYGVKPVRNKVGKISVDDDALPEIAKREPLLAPICDMLSEYRSLGVFLNTFVRAPLDHDKRMRCSYNPVGTETFRLNSKADAFGYGTNLQNIPLGGEK